MNLAYKVEFEKPALKELKACPKNDQTAIVKKVRDILTQNPFPQGKTVKKLQGLDVTVYRLRVNASQSYRVFYQVFGERVVIRRIVSKKDADRVIKVLKKYLKDE